MPERISPCTVVVFAKEPVPGTVKTRFCPPCDAAQATELYRAFVRDTIALVARAKPSAMVMAYDAGASDGEPVWLREAAGDGWAFVDQGAGDLGDRLARITGGLVAEGGPVIVIGSDSPTLPAALLSEAARALDNADAVLGPTLDGGYYLVGMVRPMPELFRDIPWSTERVWPETLARLAQTGAEWYELPRWYDLDSADAVHRWLAEDPHGDDAPRTRAAVRDLAEVLGMLRAE